MAGPAKLRCTLVSTIKDEGPYLLEWLAYYKVIGFSHAEVFYNNCNDLSDDMLRALSRRTNFVTCHENSKKASGDHYDPQRRAYQRAALLPNAKDADYVLVADADEFLNIKAGAGHLDDLFDATGEFDVMSVTWRIFGTADCKTITDDFVIDQFRQARFDEKPKFVRLWGAKSMFKPDDVVKYGVHRPYHTHDIRKGRRDIAWVNGSGLDVLKTFRDTGWRVFRASHGAQFAEMNHYALRSVDGFLVKQSRGSANAGGSDRLDQEYFDMYNCNDVAENGITRMIPQVAAQVAEWKNTVPGLSQLHQHAMAWHRNLASKRRGEMQRDDPKAFAHLGLTADVD